jgi:pseudaminic acid synthase
MAPRITINGRAIGYGEPCYIVAEMSANHGMSFERAVSIIKAAKEAGADAVKLQTYTPETLTLDVRNEYFQIKDTIWEGKNLYDLYGEAYTPWEWQPKLQKIAAQHGIDFFSTPFDFSSVDFLEKLNVPAYKIASFEIVDIPLLRRVAKTGKPVILSTGMSSMAEIDEAVGTLREAGNDQIALLKCTSAYPAPLEEMNLRTIPHLTERFEAPVGLSDHTLGFESAIAAVALGACILEKHLTLSRHQPGPDSAFSMEPDEFKHLVASVRSAEKALGRVQYLVTARENSSKAFRRSLFVVLDMQAGEEFTELNLRCIRPGFGLHPRYLTEIFGRRAKREIPKGTPLSWDIID